MNIAYLDCSSGISGDMLLGAWVDAGVPFKELEKGLSLLKLKGYKLSMSAVKRAGFRATKVNVEIKAKNRSKKSGVRNQGAGIRGQGAVVRKWKDINSIIAKSFLSADIKQKGLKIFRRLFEAEAKVHGEKFTEIHLHELGAIDCIVDIFGTLICLDLLKIEKLYSSPLNLGSGTIKTEHGVLSVPAPATLELLKGIPVYSSDISFELTTPTGAVIVSTLANGFGSMPEMQISKAGTGAGNKDFKKQPNVIRTFIGKETKISSQKSVVRSQDAGNSITVIETNIDDMNPQVYEYVMEKLFKEGALDVFLTPIIMKKGRPGIKLSVLCNEDRREQLADIMLNETTSIGVRFYRTDRKILNREIRKMKSAFGKVHMKISQLSSKKKKISAEYDDCKKIAEKYNIPLYELLKKAGH